MKDVEMKDADDPTAGAAAAADEIAEEKQEEGILEIIRTPIRI